MERDDGAESTANPWTVLESRRVYDSAWFSLVEHRIIDAAGRQGQYGVVHYKRRGVIILPIDADRCTILVGQYRFALGEHGWELPAGGGEPAEHPRTAAIRELAEETGFRAGQWLELGRLAPSGALADARETIYLAWDLAPAQRRPDPQEVLSVRRVPFRAALEMALSGEIRHAASVAGLTMAHLRALRGELPVEITAHLA